MCFFLQAQRTNLALLDQLEDLIVATHYPATLTQLPADNKTLHEKVGPT